MFHLSRRGFVVSAAAAAAAFGLDRRLEIMPSALAQGSGSGTQPKAIPYKRFRVGDIGVTQISDGMWEKPHDPGFVKNASLDDVKKALVASKLTDAHVPIPFTITVVRIKGRYVMFDSATGGQLAPTAGLMMSQNMKAAGIDPGKISTIVMTHFHPDHLFGLMAKDTNAQVFPNAEIVVPAAEYKFWTDPATIGKLPTSAQGLARRIQATLPTWKNVRQIEAGKEAIAGITSIPMPGHTPGHTAYVMGSGSRQLIVSADTANIPSLFLRNPGWHVAFDSDATLAEANRRKLFDRVVSDKAIVTGYHFGMPGAGRLAKDGGSYVLKAVG